MFSALGGYMEDGKRNTLTCFIECMKQGFVRGQSLPLHLGIANSRLCFCGLDWPTVSVGKSSQMETMIEVTRIFLFQ